MMKGNSKIYLKGRKDPRIVSEASATKINEMFIDEKVLGMQPFNSSKGGFLKQEIKAIDILPDTEEYDQNAPRKPQWVIFSNSRRAIFNKPYESYQEAKAEYDFQTLNMSLAEVKALDWVIENWGGDGGNYVKSLMKSAQ